MADRDLEAQNTAEESVQAIVTLAMRLHHRDVIDDGDLKAVLGEFSGGDKVAEKHLDNQ